MTAVCCLLLGVAAAQSVVIPADADIYERRAGEELSTHLKLPLTAEGGTVSEGAIYVGKTKFARDNGITFEGFAKEEWLVRAAGKSLIVGGGAPRGVVYAALELLERHFGVMWLDERTTYIPEKLQIAWPGDLNWRGKPVFDIRGIYAYHRYPQGPRRIFMARNRQNHFHGEGGLTEIESWGVHRMIGRPGDCHTYYEYTKDWGPECEELFSLSAAGKRVRAVSGSGPGQVCMTNPKTRELFTSKLKEYIRADRAESKDGSYPLVYDVSANDNHDKCVCANCTAAAQKYGAYSGLVVEFTNAIAAGIADEYPDIKIQMFAYMFAMDPPSGIKARDNVLIRVAQLGTEFNGDRDSLRPLTHPNNAKSLKQFLNWSKVGSISIWDYWIMYRRDLSVSSCVPAIPANLKIYQENGVKMFFAESESPLTTIFYALRIWLGFRCINNPGLDAAPEIERFMNAYYGPAAAPMREFLAYVDRRNAEIKELLTDVPLRRRTDLDDAFFAEADRLLDAASTAAAGRAELLRRIAKERAVVDQVRLARRAELAAFDLNAVMDRLTADYRIACEDYLSEGGAVQTAMDKLEIYFAGLRSNIPTPEQFRNAEIVVDLGWPQLTPHYRSKLTDDPDAAGGKTIALFDGKSRNVLEFGFYDVTNKRQIHSISIGRESLPLDEKFHYYPVGKVTLPPKSYVWAHPSWEIQRNLDEFYENIGTSNDYEIFVSLKVQGPLYVEGSTKENAVMLDRILLIRPQEGVSSPSGLPLPPETDGKVVAHDLTWQRLNALPAFKVTRERDADAAGGIALKLSEEQHGKLQFGMYDVANKKMLFNRTVTADQVPRDGKFHLFPLGRVTLSPDCYVWAHPSCKIQRNLKEFYQADGDNSYEILLSLKVQGPAYVPGSTDNNAILMDRIILMR